MKPLDIVKTPSGDMGVIQEVNPDGSAAIRYFKGCNNHDKCAWWHLGEGLVVLDSLPSLLADAMAHPFGSNTRQGDRFFPQDDQQSEARPSQ